MNINTTGSGRVSKVGEDSTYGKYVIIDHGKNKKGELVQTLYAHNSNILVKEGQWIGYGQTIALLGNTGPSTGPHSHYAMRVGGKAINPEGKDISKMVTIDSYMKLKYPDE